MSADDPGSRPELKLGSHLVPGLAAVALFIVLAVVTLSASFGAPAGFSDTYTYNVTLGDADAVENASVVREGGDTFATYEIAGTDDTQQQYVSGDPDANVSFATAGGDRIARVTAETGITASIAHAMFGTDQTGGVPGESFVVALIVIAVVLDAALDGAIFLAKSESGEDLTTALSDGGREALDRVRGGDD